MRFNIVKQSDVSFGTALHYALDWTYGCKALCGKPMRSTARDGEIGYKRVCGSCRTIMAKRVEAAHAEALLTQVELDHAEALEIAKDRLDIADFDEEAVYAQAAQRTESSRVAVDAVGPIHQGVPKVGDFILIGNAGGAHQSPGSYGYTRTEVLAVETRDKDSIYPMTRVTTRAFGQGCWTSGYSTRLICGARPAVTTEAKEVSA